MGIEENLHNRKVLYTKLRAEVIGPDPTGLEVDINPMSQGLRFTWEDFRKPKKQKNGEEILWQDSPAKRFGAGILYPIGINDELETVRSLEEEEALLSKFSTDDLIDLSEQKDSKKTGGIGEDADDYDVTLSNAFKPSALGLSFLGNLKIQNEGFFVEIVNVGRLSSSELVETSAATYKKVGALVGDGVSKPNATLWLRVPLIDEGKNYPRVFFSTEELFSESGVIRKRIQINDAFLEILVVVRGGYTKIKEDQKLITVSLVNRKRPDEGRVDELCLFQSGLRVKGAREVDWIEPYPETALNGNDLDDGYAEEKRNQILYRQYKTFAIGHGCAVDWQSGIPGSVSEVWTDVLPTYETPTVSADLYLTNNDGSKVPFKVSMRKLAGLDPEDDGYGELNQLIEAYSNWIDSLKAPRDGVMPIPSELTESANDLIDKCEQCKARIIEGIAFLKSGSQEAKLAKKAFELANYAMLIAQLRSGSEVRTPTQTSNSSELVWLPSISNINPQVPSSTKGYWRAFQIAFLLMSITGIVDQNSSERETVDLIWFPTGGGKTEAYLGLTAFTILFNRISGRNSGGADVLMRYTLRLLTAQQFQRAALLFCALEMLRKDESFGLGNKPFTIGLWVGGSTTPNTRKDALRALKELERDSDSLNPFVLLKCPWCGAAFGPSGTDLGTNKGKFKRTNFGNRPPLFGYKLYKTTKLETVVFSCGDPACDFGNKPFSSSTQHLPIVIIDEDLVENPPNLIIGTVDKFAMLAWKPSLRSIFGIGENGCHNGLPPTLIIQDELHLISGPLGSMVGAYETVIDRLCIDDLGGAFKPKIVASTATISRAFEQIRNLYARENTFLFPPSGLEAGDSFFSREDKDDDGNLKPGRMYVGVLAPAHGSLQTTEARVFASLLQHTALMQTDDLGRDPWWTLLCFFNSIRELGSAASLFVSDTRDYLRVILDRYGVKYDAIRKLFEVTELTSRIRSDQVPKELERLEKTFSSSPGNAQDTVDACLASNIIEVGVDIARLSLMAIVGQPKTTSQYIQVSSRVGRNLSKPGMVVVLYGQSKPRDRSHYERFRPYHHKLYAQVEPTSVTPFSPPAIERALHGIIVSAIRQLGNLSLESESPNPFPLQENTKLYKIILEMIEDRVKIVAPEEHQLVMAKFRERLNEWKVWNPAEYGGFTAGNEDAPLIYQAGKSKQPTWGERGWPTVTSLRDVDAPCQGEVTPFFNQVQREEL